MILLKCIILPIFRFISLGRLSKLELPKWTFILTYYDHISSPKFDTKLFCFKQSKKVPNEALSDLENWSFEKWKCHIIIFIVLLFALIETDLSSVCKLAVFHLMNYLFMSFVQLSTDSLKFAYNPDNQSHDIPWPKPLLHAIV